MAIRNTLACLLQQSVNNSYSGAEKFYSIGMFVYAGITQRQQI